MICQEMFLHTRRLGRHRRQTEAPEGKLTSKKKKKKKRKRKIVMYAHNGYPSKTKIVSVVAEAIFHKGDCHVAV